ncbi:MAG: hypothetical protein Q8N19_12735 [Phenylobacterium sp.]|uniref:hypothetical protein n=1 Tax=Phenylobacterium sp. TaxID=1871053 RepID=UPI002736994D|nr:hypothetical protein [Phenylobacterium sp.]MDP3117967.1 hypothetical protein [Phenylobacterium sp.]
MTSTQTPRALIATPAHDDRGGPCLAVPLWGALGDGKAALLDDDGLAKLRAAGAHSLSLTGDGQGRQYVVFRRPTDGRLTAAARVILDAPIGSRVEYQNGDRLDLRARSLTLRKYAKAGAGRGARRVR